MKIKQAILSTIFTTLTLCTTALFAQNPITVSVTPSAVPTATEYSFTVIIPNTNQRDIKKNWQQYVSKGSKGSASETNGESLQTGVVNGNVSPTPFNVFSKVTDVSEGTRLHVWLDERSISATPNSGQHLAMQKYVQDFAVQEYKAALQRDLKEAENKLQVLERQYASMINNEEKSIKKINSNDRANVRSSDAILTNNSDIRSSSEKISEQKGMVDYTAADANANKGARKTLKEMKSDKKDLQRDNDKRAKRVAKRDVENRESDRNTDRYQEQQRAKALEIEQQKAVVAELKSKLDSI